jgi:putative DNA primase/helicase
MAVVLPWCSMSGPVAMDPRYYTGAAPEPPFATRIPGTQLDWALRFASWKSWLRYVHGIGWHIWDDQRWKRDDDGLALREYTLMVKDAWAELQQFTDPADRKKAFLALQAAEKANFADGVLRFASVQPEMAVAASSLDSNRMLLNCANGTLNLDTMELKPHYPDHNITKVCKGAWIPDLGETRWSKFVSEILPDAEVRDFVQRLMGSALTGTVRDHILAILTGTGGNGKSTFIESSLDAVGDYGIQADPRLLMASRHDAHPTGQAALQSRRLAVCMETAEGRRLDAPTAKQLTGGDTITARYMRQDFFSFEPSHTLLMVTNHKPVVSGSDEALWRRLAVVPFEQKFGSDKADLGLKDTLRSRPDAVLSWMIQGWIAYREHGLEIPRAVRVATEAYKADSDAVGRYLDECTLMADKVSEQSDRTQSSKLFADWQKWCTVNGEEAGSQKAFSEELTRRGLPKKVIKGKTYWMGLTLLNWQNADGVEGSEGLPFNAPRGGS